MKRQLIIIVFIIIFLTGCSTYYRDKKLIEIIKSPNEKYEIRTYLHNCGATCDFGVSAELCDINNSCKQIYHCYHENISFVYWIDDGTIFINQKILNVFKDKFDSMDYDDAFRLISNLYSAQIYLIYNNNEYKLTETEVYYIKKYANSIFNFDKNNIYNDYDLVLKIVDSKQDKILEYFIKIDKNRMFAINGDKMSELNRTDYEYLKKILISSNLYKFN